MLKDLREKLIQELISKDFYWNLLILNLVFQLNTSRINIGGGWFYQLASGSLIVGFSISFIFLNSVEIWKQYKVKQYMNIGIKTIWVLFSTLWIWSLWRTEFDLRLAIFTYLLISFRFILKLFRESGKQKVEIANILNYARYSFTIRRYEIYLLIMVFLWPLGYGLSKEVYIDGQFFIVMLYALDFIRIKDFDFEKILPFNKREKAFGVLLFIVVVLGMNFIMLDLWKYLIVKSFALVKFVWIIPLLYEIVKVSKRNERDWEVMLKEYFYD